MGYIKAFVPKSFLSFQLFHADERFQVFALRASGFILNKVRNELKRPKMI